VVDVLDDLSLRFAAPAPSLRSPGEPARDPSGDVNGAEEAWLVVGDL
jgi:hypothetical protein